MEQKPIIFVANFKCIVLEAQKELWAQIWGATAQWKVFFEKMKILRGFSVFWSFLQCQLQIDRSPSSEGVERDDLSYEEVELQRFIRKQKSYVDFHYFGLFTMVNFNLIVLQSQKELSEVI